MNNNLLMSILNNHYEYEDYAFGITVNDMGYEVLAVSHINDIDSLIKFREVNNRDHFVEDFFSLVRDGSISEYITAKVWIEL